jgi:hypothetical protein
MSRKPTLTEELFRIHEMMGLTENQLDMFAGTEDEAPEEGAEDSHIGKRVMVYYNLHKHTFSIQYKGLVIAHADYVKLNNVEFRVRQGGKEKVRAEMSKNVHAFVIGDLVDFIAYPSTDIPSASGSKSITYDPYKYDTFVYRDTEEPVMNAREVEMINQPGGKIFQINEVLSENWSYDENKINQFVVEAEKDVQMADNLINKFGVNVVNMTLKDIHDNMAQMESAKEKLNASKDYITRKYEKFYDIVETYEVGEYPDNVSKLYDLSNKLDNQKESLSDLAETFNTLIDAANWLGKYNKEIFDIQNIK